MAGASAFRRTAHQALQEKYQDLRSGIGRTIKAALRKSAADLIDELNPKIRGWAHYHRHVLSKRALDRADHEIFSSGAP
jgi:RNA-directed DNA polymerase